MQLTAREIADIVGGTLVGNADEPVTGVSGIREAQPGDLTFIGHPRYLAAAKNTRASVIIVPRDLVVESPHTLVRVDNPSVAFTRIVERSAPAPVRPTPGIHSLACVAPSAKLGADVAVGAFAVIEEGAVIGDRSFIGAGCYIGHESVIGADCLIYPRVTMRERTRLGQRVILHSGVVLGADGFGFETIRGERQKVPQIGTVELGDDVELGANSCIDRGRFGKTRVGKGTKIDNLVQIGHNCVIGEHCVICGGVGIAGSVIVENYVTIAGQVGIAGHLTIGEQAVLGAQCGVARDVPPGVTVFGAPAIPHLQFKRSAVYTARLPSLVAKLREMEQQLAEMRSQLDSVK